MGKLFGTDGIRGIANRDLTADLALKVGKAAAQAFVNEEQKPLFVIGKDTRISGDMLENALTAGILSLGGNVIKLGVIPTPGVAYLLKYYGADAGIVISASHNSFEYNGIKFFNSEGFKLDDAIEEAIEQIVLSSATDCADFFEDATGTCFDACDDAIDLYISFLLSTIDMRLDGVKIVLDAANGAAYRIAEKVYTSLGAEVIMIASDPDGININRECGSTHPEKLQKTVIEAGADIGFAFDGDADRLIAVDDKGRLLDGDLILCLCGNMLKEKGTLTGNSVTATVMSNIGLHKYFAEKGIDVNVTGVGDRHVIESMLENGSILGGEQSGHMIFLDYTTTGDGVLSSLQFMKAFLESGLKVSELRDQVCIYPQVVVNAKINANYKKFVLKDEKVLARISEIEERMEGSGRVLIRPSGTEPLIRVMIEGEDADEIREYAEYIASLISEKFNVDK